MIMRYINLHLHLHSPFHVPVGKLRGSRCNVIWGAFLCKRFSALENRLIITLKHQFPGIKRLLNASRHLSVDRNIT